MQAREVRTRGPSGVNILKTGPAMPDVRSAAYGAATVLQSACTQRQNPPYLAAMVLVNCSAQLSLNQLSVVVY